MSHRHIPSRLGAGAAAPAPASDGHRPMLLALALASGFAALPAAAQPTGAQAIHGTAALSAQGANLVVSTQNGAGTRHSAINWQSFSVPGGSTTHFAQPDAASTSINRVLGGNPSAIFGTLSSNGRLVLVNPAGIAVGAGAVVDTAGFTASTLRMSDADAIAGRLRFGDGSAAAPLRVDGRILASSGDVVLIGTDVQAGAQAVIRSPQGATVLAAGQKVELTGRGLEGIRLEVQAPGDQAVNLGTLEGDAVGIFAGTLRHSGLVRASAATLQGGRVVLKAAGDALVDGAIAAKAGDKGGGIDVFGHRVGLLAEASLDASGDQGGGRIRVGGGYQGLDPDAPNAARVYVDASASIKADAIQQGDGGRVIVWSDELTRMHGHISARGGAQGGDGGFAEVSGKRHLEFTSVVDLRAPQGATGTLLLDPQDITIVRRDPTLIYDLAGLLVDIVYGSVGTMPVADTIGSKFEPTTSTGPVVIDDAHLVAQLNSSHVVVKTAAATGTGGQITLNADAVVSWTSGNDLSLLADKGITLAGTINGGANGGLHLQSLGGDITQPTTGLITANRMVVQSSGAVSLLGANAVDKLAGTAAGGFFVKNARTLHVGGVATAHASELGITAGSVRLETTSATADIDVNGWVRATTGSVVVDAGGSITGAGIYETQGGSAGPVLLHARGGDVEFESIHARGAANDATGGNVDVIASGSIRGVPGEVGDSFTVDATGGWGAVGQTGGRGGDVTLRFGGALGPGYIYADGGGGGDADGGGGGDADGTTVFNGSSGGTGGRVFIERTAGDLVLANLRVDADGGLGGSSAANGGVGGRGGAGGDIVLKANGGKLVLSNSGLSAYSGDGGYTAPTGSYGPQGAMGTLSVIATSTEVAADKYSDLYADWTNSATLSVRDRASLNVQGTFRNKGQVFLFDGSALTVSNGTFQNEGLLKGVTGSASASLARNVGTVQVAAGASLTLAGFASNAGTVIADGTLEVMPFYDPCATGCEVQVATASVPTPGAFTNQATGALTGTGVISVDGGNGTIDNLGVINPAGAGGIGTLTINSNLAMGDTSTLAVDIASLTSHDLLSVTGKVTAGGRVAPTYAAGTSFPSGTTFSVVQAGALDATVAPVSLAPELAVMPSGSELMLQALAKVPAPAPAPAPAPTTTEQAAAQQTAGEVVQFAEQFEERKKEEAARGKDDIVLTDTACKPAS